MKTLKYKYRITLAFVLVISISMASFSTYAQSKTEQPVDQLFLSGPKGTVMQFIFGENYIEQLKFDPQDKVMIYKSTGKNKKRSLIGETAFPSSAAEFSQRLGPENTLALMQNLKVGSEEALYQKVKNEPVDSLGLNLFSLELQLALGLSYIDTEWKAGEAAHYEIEKVNASGQVLHSINHTVSGKTPQYNQKFSISEEAMSDTLAHFTWSVPQPIEFRGAYPIFSKLMQKKDLEAEYTVVGQGMVSPSVNGDSSHVYYRQEIQKGQAYSFYSVLYDWAGNESPPSDTAYTLSVAADEIALITEFRAQPENDAIALSWNGLPQNALYAGIEISKSRSKDSGYVVLDTLGGQEISYLDKQILKGSAYYYQIRPLLLVDNPSLASSYSESSATILYAKDNPAPEMPVGLKLGTHAEGIQLSWWTPNELDIYGYYVLRGTTAHNMERIGEIVQDTVFVDRDFPAAFSGDLHYALLAMNQNQQLSDTSEIASFAIRQEIILTPPAGLSVYLADESISMRWNDVKVVDDRVVSYLLLRRKKGEEKYDLVKVPERIDVPFYNHPYHLDEETKPVAVYEYAVVSRDIYGNFSAPSSPAEVNLQSKFQLPPPSEVIVRNLAEGIEISWPTPYGIGNEVYVIYRKAENESEAKEIGRITPQESDYFIDATAQNDGLLEYSIAVLKNNIEGERSSTNSIRR